MQTSPSTPTHSALRSGRVPPTPRSSRQTQPIRLVIGDGNHDFRRAIRARFGTDRRFEVVGEADDGEVALQLIRCLRPDVALLDEDLSSFGGGAIARVLRSQVPETRIVVLTRARTRRGLRR